MSLCLLTGATGFIGGHLAERLVEEGYEVRCLVRPTSDTSRLRGLGVETVLGELGEPRSLARAAGGCELVFHCAALVSDWATRAEIVRVNVAGTHSLLEASRRASVRRFIHLSSTDIYGHPDGGPIAESYTATRFHNWYAQSKLEAEREVSRAASAHRLETVILRPATVFGPGSVDVVAEVARALRAGHMVLIDRGRPIAGLCYVENLIDAMLLAARHDAAPGQAFNISDALPVSWRGFTDDLAAGLDCAPARWSVPYPLAHALGFSLEHGYRLLRRSTGLSTPPLLSRQAVQVLGRDQDFCTRKAREIIGWEPRVDYPSALAATLDWLRAAVFSQ